MADVTRRYRKVAMPSSDEQGRGRKSYRVINEDDPIDNVPALTPTQRQLLQRLAATKTEEQIAEELEQSVHTLQNNKSRLRRQWGGLNLVAIYRHTSLSGDLDGRLDAKPKKGW